MLRSPGYRNFLTLSTGQLDFIRERWSELLGRYLYRLLSSLDLIREEEKMSFMGPGPVPIPIYDLSSAELEPENFSADREWMVRLVLDRTQCLCLAGPAQQDLPAFDHYPPGPGARGRIGNTRPLGYHRFVVNRAVGTQPGFCPHQAA
jgi:hypothetical protein